jgi:hypothetical protein
MTLWTRPQQIVSHSIWVLMAPADCRQLTVALLSIEDARTPHDGFDAGRCVEARDSGQRTAATAAHVPQWHVTEWVAAAMATRRPSSFAELRGVSVVLRLESGGPVYALSMGPPPASAALTAGAGL